MNAYCAPASRPHPLYLVECNYGHLGRAFQETDRDDNSRVEIVRQIRNGSVDVVKVLLVDEIAGTVTDVTEEILSEASEAREVPTHDELVGRFRGMRMDHERDLKRKGPFGW